VPISPDQLPEDPQALKRIMTAMAQHALASQAETTKLKFHDGTERQNRRTGVERCGKAVTRSV